MWHVRAQTRSMKNSIEGDFKLFLNEQQISLISKDNPEQVLTLQVSATADTSRQVNNFQNMLWSLNIFNSRKSNWSICYGYLSPLTFL